MGGGGSKNSSKNSRGYSFHKSLYLKDAEVLRMVQDIKVNFDNSHYQNLKTMSPIVSKGFLKRFPPQFVALNAAFGLSIYREILTDSALYGAEKNPDMLMQAAEQSLSPSGLVSFAIFLAVSQQVHYRLYGGGRLMDGRVLKTPFGNLSFNGKMARSSAPNVALAAGYFAYVIFSDLMNDQNLKQCVKNQFQGERTSNINPHQEPCDAFFLTWKESEKWKHYAVDGFTILGSAWLSHRLVSRLFMALEPFNLGGLIFRSGKFIATRTYAGMATQALTTLYFFVEFHKLLEEWVGKPLKEQLTAGAIKNSIMDFSLHLDNKLSHLDSLSEIGDQNSFSEELSQMADEAKEQIARIGYKFKKWAEIKGNYYHQSVHLWSKKLNKLTGPYFGASQLLKDLFLSSHLQYDFELSEEAIWNSDKDMKEQKDKWNQLNAESLAFSFVSFDNLEESQKEKYCSQIAGDENFFINWKILCEKSFRNMDKLSLVYETAFLIQAFMRDFLEDSSSSLEEKERLDFKAYIGKSFDETFSSHPDYLIQNLSGKKRFQLSSSLIQAGLDWTNSLSHFSNIDKDRWREEACQNWYPQYKTDEDMASIYNLCLKGPEQAKAYCASRAEQTKGEINIEREEAALPKDWDYDFCLGFFESVKSSLSQKISAKLLRAGLYLLKEEVLKALFYRNDPASTNPYEELARSPYHYSHLLNLTNLLEVYKKGERYFTQMEKTLEMLKSAMDSETVKEIERQLSLDSNPYFLTQSLLCAQTEGEEVQNFVIPQFFSLSGFSIYDFSLKQFVDLEDSCKDLDRFYLFSGTKKKLIHHFLFQRPVQIHKTSYENLYLALESILKLSYSSSQNVAEAFQQLSQRQLEDLGGRLSKDLNNLTENYYKELINPENKLDPLYNSMEEFDSYYHKQKILFDVRSFTGGGIRGLEIPLFQIHYWMQVLKQLLQVGETLFIVKTDKEGKEEQVSLNQDQLWSKEPFNKAAFEQMQWEILSLLQSYHNSYKKAGGPYLFFPEEDFVKKLQTLFKETGKEGLEKEYQGENSQFLILKRQYPSSLPVFMPPDMILSHILEFSIPNWNNPGQIQNFNGNPSVGHQPWEDLIFSLIFEINKSLNLFFSQVQALSLKESFDRELSFK